METKTPRAEPLLAISLALLGWVPLFLAVAMAVGGAGVTPIAICFFLAGTFGIPAIVVSVLAFVRTRGAGQALSALAFAIAAPLTAVAIFFATTLG